MVGKKFTIDIDPQICCDNCNECIGNRMTCPVCNREAGIYVLTPHSSGDETIPAKKAGIECSNCGSQFIHIDEINSACYGAEWSVVVEGKKV